MEHRFDIGRWPRMHARWRGEQAAIIDGDRRVTYAKLAERTHRLAHALRGLGVGFGDRVALLLQNRVETVEAILALASLGAIAVPLNYRLVARELAFMLRDSGSQLSLVDPAFASLTDALRAEDVPAMKWIDVDADYEALLERGRPEPVDAEAPITEDTPHVILYTAGTTGLPKGVVLTHGNTFWQTINAVNLGLMPGVVGLSILPLFHVGGLNGSVLPVLFIGGTVVLQRAFDPVQTLALIEKHRVQGMVGVPAVFQALAAMPQFATTDLSSVLAFTSGGAPLPLHTIALYEKRGVVFRQGYGLTEAAPGVTGMEPHDAYQKPGSVGRPCHHTEVRVVDAAGNECPPGERGEIIVRGPNVMPGYWNRPDETAAALRDGWLRTGDAGHVDADGYLFVSGRIKEMIISGGENIYPAEVVNALAEHPAVADSAVVGAPDERWGQRPVAFVVAWPGQTLTAEMLSAFLQGRLARYKQPREYHFLPMLPRNATGKVVTAKLLEMLTVER